MGLFYSTSAIKALCKKCLIHPFIQALFLYLSAFCVTFTYIHNLMDASESNLVFSVFPKGTLACRLEQPGIHQPSDE